MAERTKIFISYSHSDQKWLKRLQVHLKPFVNANDLEVWDDTKIQTGSKWKEDIEQALQQTKVAVLLISADFFASDFIRVYELPPLLKAGEEGSVRILSLIIDPSAFTESENISRYQAVNPPSKPLGSLSRSKREKIFADLAKKIRDLFQEPQTDQPGTKTDGRIEPAGKPVEPPGNTRAQGQINGAEVKLPVPTVTAGTTAPGSMKKTSPLVWTAMSFGVVALIVALLFYYNRKPEVVEYKGQILNARNNQAIIDAKITLASERGSPSYNTDTEGRFHLPIERSSPGPRIVIEAPNYNSIKQDIDVGRAEVAVFRLEPALEIYKVRVLKQNTPQGIPGAEITVSYQDPYAPAAAALGLLTRQTNEKGLAEVELYKSLPSANFKVQASSYSMCEKQSVQLSPGKEVVISLSKEADSKSASSQKAKSDKEADSKPAPSQAEKSDVDFNLALNACRNKYEGLNNPEEALPDCKRAHSLKPQDPTANRYLKLVNDEIKRRKPH